eukprot:CAMPEP_0117078420 /NCGR_PEP_ID=MMETSP0472-20121206/55299_1 /TAXON_ID=693140 ORGANISM="Tiarina fusus, Strain LIS" /NCGR_SAMPLE_ID=MMETSP0472 /ASSEMBLY_ACC=CAM_ASM_000603 /LENGTH=140 /DNA_ID=CAMNT_0004805169 /DNA_START=133 /DNA_END=555 /DNA_ORIENTATION=+
MSHDGDPTMIESDYARVIPITVTITMNIVAMIILVLEELTHLVIENETETLMNDINTLTLLRILAILQPIIPVTFHGKLQIYETHMIIIRTLTKYALIFLINIFNDNNRNNNNNPLHNHHHRLLHVRKKNHNIFALTKHA